MSILIRGMKMPEHCYMCNLAHRAFDGNETRLACYAIKKWCVEDEGRRDDCPLAELPEKHGRLVDADIAYDKIAEQEGGYYMDMDGVDMGLSETPTIIEAEGDEE